MNAQLSIYENAKHWIAQYESVDEVKEYIDKAAAIEEYARRANDYEMEHQAARARVRAERRCGELLLTMEKAKGTQGQLNGRDTSGGRTIRPPENKNRPLSNMGLSKDQSSKFQQLANVPEDEFEKALNIGGAKPSIHSLLKSLKPESPPQRIVPEALDLWGMLLDCEKKFFGQSCTVLVEEMTPAMQPDARRIIPMLIAWLGGKV